MIQAGNVSLAFEFDLEADSVSETNGIVLSLGFVKYNIKYIKYNNCIGSNLAPGQIDGIKYSV